MKSISPKTLFLFSSRNLFSNFEIPPNTLFKFSHFSASPIQFHSFSHSSPTSSSYRSRRHEEESRLVRVSVWWDFENCTVPAGSHVSRVAQIITTAVRAKGIKGPIQITAFGDVMQMSRSNQEALSSTGINLTHVPRGGKNSADRSLLVDLMCWVSQNPPPAHLFLISSDKDFANILHRLRLNNYNILLSSSDDAPAVLRSAASIMWGWNALVRGENLCGKHFNQPPDGPYGSWYGHYRLPLEDPFAVIEQPASSRAKGSSGSGSEPNLRPVPKVVVEQIRHILNSYPEGLSITELRSELGKTNVNLDKDLYGYKKFSCFLLSNSHILKIQSCGEGQLSIRSIAPKVLQSAEDATSITSGTVANNGDLNRDISSKRNSRDSSCSGLEKKTPLPTNPKVNARELLKELQESPKQVEEPLNKVSDSSPRVEKENKSDVVREPLRKSQESQNQVEEPLKKVSDPPPFVEKANNAEVTNSHLCSMEGKNAISKVGFLNVIWRKWFGAKDSGSEKKNSGKPDKYGTSNCSTEKIKETKTSFVNLTSQSTSLIGLDSKSSSTHEVIADENSARSCEANEDKSSRGPGFFNKIIKWCKFWSSPKSDNASELSSDNLSVIVGENKEQHILSTESFWNDMVAFVDAPRGSNVITQSKTRKEMAQNLRKDGPSVLRYLVESDLLHLVDLLISDKKWVEEYPSQKFPFKIILPAEKGSLSNNTLNSHNSNSLTSIFLDTQSLSDSKKQHAEKRNQNVSYTGVSPPAIHKNLSKSRDQILADCRKLVEYVVKTYPSGFNMGGFGKLFLDRYGYSLDVQKLGYQKLVSLLQIIPRVKIESNYIIPELPFSKVQKSSGVELTYNSVPQNNAGGTIAKSDGDFSASSRKFDDLDSQWEELGPVSDTSPKRNDMERSSGKLKEETIGQVNHKYETLSDEYFSGSDDKSLSSTGSEGQDKTSIKGGDGSLLRILDSWHVSEDEDSRNAAMESYKRKQRPPTSYSFVLDKVVDDKNKLVDGILGSLTKSSEMSAKSRIQA